MKVSPLRWMKMLEWSRAGGVNEVARIDFRGDGVYQAQTDETMTVGTILRAKKKFFTQYEPLGAFSFDTQTMIKALKGAFRDDNEIEVKVADGRIYMRGSREEISRVLLDSIPNEVESEIKETEYGLLPADITDIYQRVIVIDAAELKSLTGDEYHISWSDKGASVSIYDEYGSYERKLKVITNKKLKDKAEGKVIVSGGLMKKVIAVLNGPVTVMLSEDAPLALLQKTDEYSITYIISPYGGGSE